MRNAKLGLVIVLVWICAALPARALQESDTEAVFRFAHFSIDVPALEIYVNEELAHTLESGSVSDWLIVPTGVYSIAAVLPGEALADAQLEITDMEAEPGTWLNILVVGSIEAETLDFNVFEEVVDPLDEGMSRLGFVNAAEGAPLLDLVIGGENIFEGVEYIGSTDVTEDTDSTLAASVDIESGTYNLEIVLNENGELFLEVEDVHLAANVVYLLAIYGAVDDPQVVLIETDLSGVSGDDQGDGSGYLRIAHLASGTSEIDVYVNGEASIAGLPFAQLTEFIEIPAGEYAFSVTLAGNAPQQTIASDLEIQVEADQWVTIVLIGLSENNTLELRALVENFQDLPANEAHISVFHANPRSGPVMVRLSDGTVLIQRLAYPGTQGDNDGLDTFRLDAASYGVEVVSINEPGSVMVNLPRLRLAAGRYYLIAVILAEPAFVLAFADVVESAED